MQSIISMFPNLKFIPPLKLTTGLKSLCTKVQNSNLELSKLRNIGILAHIDAGKTTTTERMLYYSGTIQQMGEVHRGNTVTDYMLQERERGITITSAAVTFNWKNHQFNLIDTPGHIDFTMEVEQTLNVLDGAVVILDASAGVEAQTLTVWRQADQYKLPRIVFVNKMDRLDANLNMCCSSIEKKFEVPTFPLQIPIVENNKLVGLVDNLSLNKLIWNKNDKSFEKVPLSASGDGKLWEEANENRTNLIDKVSGYNDELADIIISTDSLNNIKTTDVVKAISKIVAKGNGVPVLCGSSYKNIGVQPLMDAVILYLPSPDEVSKQFQFFDPDLCARAFKVIHHKQRGPLVFFRLYSGKFAKGQKIYNILKDRSEQTGRLLIAYADDFQEVEAVTNGNIAVVTGLKETSSGDLVTNSASAFQRAKKKQSINKNEDLEKLFEVGATIPEPVFFCSIEPPSLSYQAALDQALIELQREDPSLRVQQDSETGQTVLAGMGELHLEIIKDRILKEYKIEVELGPLQIAYREEPVTKVFGNLTRETVIGNSKQHVTVHLTLIPTTGKIKDILKLDKSPDAASNIAHIYHKHLLAVRRGIEVGVLHGPKLNSQVINVAVMLHLLEVGKGTSESMISATVTQLIQKLLVDSNINILEPVMSLEVAVPEEHLSIVLADLSCRRSIIQNISMRGNYKVVSSEAPLSELLGYSTVLRTITSGAATFTMEFSEYKKMTPIEENKAIQSVRGF